MLKTRRAILAWEIGDGRGHIAHLIVAAKALKQLGFTCTSAQLASLESGHELNPYAERIEAIPGFHHRTSARGRRQEEQMAGVVDWLGDHGFCDAQIILHRLLAWRDIFRTQAPDLIICDQAPFALLAARSLDIASAAIGVGYLMIPPELPCLPLFAEPPRAVEPVEAQVRDAVNCALAGLGSRRIARLPELFRCDVPLVCTNGLFDPYQKVRKAPLCPPNVPDVLIPERPGEEVFVYLSGRERTDPVVLTAIMTLQVPRRLFLSSLDPLISDMMRKSGVIVENSPVLPADIVRRSRLAVHGGSHGISSLALRGGLPSVALPDHAEQIFNSQRLHEKRAGRVVRRTECTVPSIHAAIMDVYEGGGYRDCAAEVGRELVAEFSQTPQDAIAQRIAEVLH